ncbi:hypothetical protein CVT25_007149 [Psilocybe cyanescens]|uniref:Guanine nucleotide-binding protein alpha-4 subunit n=1 Tax=Psilocybe cyanescens TaxID=93625 RepID=A0A409WVI4_PSICY|nr:hypothetical protein CVT25_007149 [Psilocybe cyanescens]
MSQNRITTRLSPDDNDPLSIHPPIFETNEERTARLAREQHAKEVSDNIDEELEQAHALERKGPKPIKILLLGQSESDFQLMYDPKAFREERASWRAVIQLNVVQSIRSILVSLTRLETIQDQHAANSSLNTKRSHPLLSPELLAIKSRLQPLSDVELNLVRRLTGSGDGSPQRSGYGVVSDVVSSKGALREIAINSAIPWKNAFGGLKKSEERSSQDSSEVGIDWDDPDDPWPILNACAQDMIQLWNNPNIKQLLAKQNVRMEDLSGYFLDSLERLTAPRYVPTDDDILHARLKTLGVSEYLFKISTTAWAPYFDDMDAIIFLAPLSCFDQVLEEDHKVNRLEDSFKLWTLIVSNELLKNTNLILFLNKIDMLRTKLASGVLLKDYVVSYGDRPNDVDNTAASFSPSNATHQRLVDLRRKFGGILHERSPSPRVFYCHFTTVTDTKSTKLILTNLKDMLMRQNLLKTNLIA